MKQPILQMGPHNNIHIMIYGEHVALKGLVSLPPYLTYPRTCQTFPGADNRREVPIYLGSPCLSLGRLVI